MRAARAVGCTPAEIAKTVLFIVDGKPVAVSTSGDVKVRGGLLKQLLGWRGKVRLPDAEEVIRYTGYAPGGVCPFLLPGDLTVVVDDSLRRFPVVYAAAGDDHSVVPVTVAQLLALPGGVAGSVCAPIEEAQTA